MHHRSTLVSVAVATAVAVTVSLLAAGCGGAGRRTAARTIAPGGAVAFAQCMRAHGVPNFPDPNGEGDFARVTQQALGVSKRTSVAAKQRCQHLLPAAFASAPALTAQQRRTQLADARSFASCIRSHGIARFPDPTPQGDLSIQFVQAQGIDVHAPAFLRVVLACLPASHGGLTVAKVRASLSQSGG